MAPPGLDPEEGNQRFIPFLVGLLGFRFRAVTLNSEGCVFLVQNEWIPPNGWGGGEGGAATWGGGAVDGGSVNAFLVAALTRVMRAAVSIPDVVSVLCCILLLLVDLS